MASADNSKSKGHKPTKKMLVSYGRIGTLGWFDHNEAHIPKRCSHVVIKTKRGLELGKIVGVYNYRGGQFRNSPQQVEEYFCNRTKDYPLGEGGRFVRYATAQDLSEQRHLEKNSIGEAKNCQQIIDEMGLKMRIVEAEHLFGGERIVFYFTSESRVDFRELVKRLAKEYQTRIELRQIGSRDEARLISDYESCGQQCCCSRFLKILEPVNMRMAKLQKATLDPSKISGHCGRLKCCLRYEDENYTAMKRNLPHRSTPVQTPKGPGKVVDTQILTQLVVVQSESGDRQAWPLDEIEILKPGQKPTQLPKKKAPEDDSAQQTDRRNQEPAEAAEEQSSGQQPQQDRPGQDKEENAPPSDKPRGKKRRRRRKKKKNSDGGQNPQDNNQQGDQQKTSDGNTTSSTGD